MSADAIRRGIELSSEGDALVPDLRTLYADDAKLAHAAKVDAPLIEQNVD